MRVWMGRDEHHQETREHLVIEDNPTHRTIDNDKCIDMSTTDHHHLSEEEKEDEN